MKEKRLMAVIPCKTAEQMVFIGKACEAYSKHETIEILNLEEAKQQEKRKEKFALFLKNTCNAQINYVCGALWAARYLNTDLGVDLNLDDLES